MEQELIQAAVSTFCTVPEVYQKIFQQMNVNFPDELVQAITEKPEEALQMVQQNKELLNNIVTIYQQYGDQINKVVQQKTGMFAKGGKLGQLLNKYQRGGSTSLKTQTPINRRELKWANIVDSFGRTGKAAKYISPDGRSEITEFLMSDNNSDVPGYANDIRLKVKRNPQTGEISKNPLDSLTSTKILPGIWLPGIPTKLQGDAPLVRGGFRRIK